MLCIVSDLHLTDEHLPGCATDKELAEFVQRLGITAHQTKSAVTLVFLGDILELLRSRKWSKLWEERRSAPWSGAARGFSNFAGGYSEACATAVASDIRVRYPLFEGELRRLVDEGLLLTCYVPGNHDYMVQLSTGLRRVVVDLLCLDHDPANEFEACYVDMDSSVLATHGHSYDPINWHRREDGYWAMGDAVVLRVVNRFVEEASKELGLAPDTLLARRLLDVENLESLIDLPIYIRWLAETHLGAVSERETFLRVWTRTVEEFLMLDHFKDTAGFSGSAFSTLKWALRISTSLELSQLLSKFADLLGSRGPDYAKEARELGASRGFRHVVFGHTHDPVFMPVGERDGEPVWYVNTGCWRRVVARTGSGQGTAFVARRVAAHFTVHPRGSTTERYELHQSCRVT